MRLAAQLVLLAALAGVAPAGQLELTGLVDWGVGTRLACVRAAPEWQPLTLRVGESVSGYVLRDLDSKEGWALFEQETNLVKIHLPNFCATASSAANPAAGPGTKRFAPGAALAPGQTRFGTTPAQPAQAPQPGAGLYPASGPLGYGAGFRPADQTSGSASPNPAVSPFQAPVSQPELADSPYLAGDPQAAAPEYPTGGGSFSSEGGRIKSFYGAAAYLQWEKAQSKRFLVQREGSQ